MSLLAYYLISMTSAAIYFHPEAYTTSGPKLMGRNSAGEGFLRGYLTHSKGDQFAALLAHPGHGQAFAEAVSRAGRQEPTHFLTRAGLQRLSEFGCIFFPGPGLGEHAWQRTVFGDAAWSICGITHTICSAGAMDGLVGLLANPVQSWDAVICTSSAAKAAVMRMLQAQEDFLAARLGAQKFILPQLPVIPLGIHSQDFAFTEEQRLAARQALEVDENTHVVLFAGRLSFHAKAHPLAMYQALELAAASLPPQQRLCLVQFGQFPNQHIADAFAAAARLSAPSVTVVTLDGRLAENRDSAWASADIFCSLSDNLQETFGLTPLEAMAAGLPCIVSDWDGYKDTVRDGVDGFRVPTAMPPGGLGTNLALRHALEVDTYDMYCGHTSSLVAVDVAATAKAFSKLLASAELRQRMGQAAKERARSDYDWAAIIPQYEALWAELGGIRRANAAKVKRLRHPWPARMDPFAAFAGYVTETLLPETMLALVDQDVTAAQERLRAYLGLAMVNFAKFVLPSEEEVAHMLQALAAGPASAAAMVHGIAPPRQVLAMRAVVWLMKMGVVQRFEGHPR